MKITVFLKPNSYLTRINLSLLFVLALTQFLFLSSCSDDSVTADQTSNDEYYVKYEIDCKNSIYRGRKMTLKHRNEENAHETSEMEQYEQREIVIGPVKRDFNASLILKSQSSDNYHLKLNLKIAVSKNNSPFALKASDLSNESRSEARLEYTIDY